MNKVFDIPSISTMSLTDDIIISSREDEGSLVSGITGYEMPLAVTDIE